MDAKNNEIIGRLWLWMASVSKTKHLLEMSFRALEGKQDQNRILEYDTYIKKLKEFSKQQSGNSQEQILNSHRQAFNETYNREFPTWLECCAIYDAFVELAIVHFCQIFNSGRSFNGQTANSDKNFRDIHLTNILTKMFPSDGKMNEFNSFKDKILNIRDKVIAHSDGEAFSISHGNPISIMRGPNISWRDIDFEYWYSFLDEMINEIQNYSNQLKMLSGSGNNNYT